MKPLRFIPLKLRIALTLSAAAAGLALLASPALAAPAFVIQGAKHKDGPFSESTQSVTINPGKTKTLYWRVISNGGDPHDLVLDDAATPHPNPEGFKVKWYRGDNNITHDVKHQGYDFTVDVDQPKRFSTKVKAIDTGDFCLGAQVTRTVPTPFTASAYFGVNGNLCV